jgi:hypothetical protein
MRTIIIILFIVLALGCITPKECGKGYITAGDECCLDENNNGKCDDTELDRIVLVVNASVISQDKLTTTTSRQPFGRPGLSIPTPLSAQKTAQEESSASSNSSLARDNVTTETIPLAIANYSGGMEYDRPKNSSICATTVVLLTNSSQDGYIRDGSNVQDGIGDDIWQGGYLMVGDLGRDGNLSVDYQYRSIIAFPLQPYLGNISDARVYVVPYLTQGTPTDILLEHIICSGSIWAGDFGSSPDGQPAVIIRAHDSDNAVYSADVTAHLKEDLNEERGFSCFRLSVNQTQEDMLDNGAVDRRVIYGFGDNFSPYLEFTKRPCIRCQVNNDCSGDADTGPYKCLDNSRVVQQFVRYRCTDPGTDYARCISSQDSLVVDKCLPDETCINGEDRCFPEVCYGGLNETKLQEVVDGVVCGDDCRPCHCLNGAKDPGESEIDCGGECTPCPPDKRINYVTILSPGQAETFDSGQVFLMYRSTKYNVDCSLSLNGDYNTTLEGDRYVSANEGENTITVYCTDQGGKISTDQVTFYVESNQSICPSDDVGTMKKNSMDKVMFFLDKSYQLGPSDSCDEGSFWNITSEKDSMPHYLGPYDMTGAMGDQIFGDSRHTLLSYVCAGGEGYELWTAHVARSLPNANYTKVGVIVYFKEEIPPSTNDEELIEEKVMDNSTNSTGTYYTTLVTHVVSRNSFWGLYPYSKDNDSVKKQGHIDIPYFPMNSTCGTALGVKYQELDITGLLAPGGEGEPDALDIRMAIYSKNRDAAIDLMEIELSVE